MHVLRVTNEGKHSYWAEAESEWLHIQADIINSLTRHGPTRPYQVVTEDYSRTFDFAAAVK